MNKIFNSKKMTVESMATCTEKCTTYRCRCYCTDPYLMVPLDASTKEQNAEFSVDLFAAGSAK